jgi:hypothetical protein
MLKTGYRRVDGYCKGLCAGRKGWNLHLTEDVDGVLRV